MRSPVAFGTGLALCLIALAGCYPTGDPVVEPAFPAEPMLRHPLTPITDAAVLAYCPDIPAQHFEGFTAYEQVYICRADEHRPSDGTSTYGPWQSVYSVGDPRGLLGRYAAPNATRIVSGACGQVAPDPLIVWVHRAGEVVAVYAPVDGCGFPRTEVVSAYQDAERELLLEVDSGGPLDEHDTPAEH